MYVVLCMRITYCGVVWYKEMMHFFRDRHAPHYFTVVGNHYTCPLIFALIFHFILKRYLNAYKINLFSVNLFFSSCLFKLRNGLLTYLCKSWGNHYELDAEFKLPIYEHWNIRNVWKQKCSLRDVEQKLIESQRFSLVSRLQQILIWVTIRNDNDNSIIKEVKFVCYDLTPENLNRWRLKLYR